MVVTPPFVDDVCASCAPVWRFHAVMPVWQPWPANEETGQLATIGTLAPAGPVSRLPLVSCTNTFVNGQLNEMSNGLGSQLDAAGEPVVTADSLAAAPVTTVVRVVDPPAIEPLFVVSNSPQVPGVAVDWM